MADHEDRREKCLLISIEATNRNALYDCYRDYLVFMSLVRDGVRSYQYKVYGFCWLQNKCLMLIQPETPSIGNMLLKLLKRYHFWLLQRGPAMTEFKMQMLELQQSSWLLDCLRFIHQHAVKSQVVDDAMDYHWHSHHVYNGFWSVNWLDTDFILNKFAGNRLAAMSRFRQYMQHPHKMDFKTLLDSFDCSKTHMAKANQQDHVSENQVVAEINSQYHQSLIDRTHISFLPKEGNQHIRITVVDKASCQVNALGYG